ncbi:MAG: 4Fe-4S dicluster domain-containing protein [Desulfobulbaceae bacterium]|nr:4Fe-4S dicluster domain-containing protein [Desulfobulbaceae bacterium]
MSATREITTAENASVLDNVADRRRLLTVFASSTFAGLVLPAVESAAQTSESAPTGEAKAVALYSELDEEDMLGRMTRDLMRALQKPIEKRHWSMLIDLRKCVGCQGCTIACIQENRLPPGIVYRPVREEVRGRYPNVSKHFLPRPCMQCDNPPCVRVCPADATWKRPDGIVEIDYDVCIGCGYCIQACPYEARTMDHGAFWGDDVSGEPEEYEKLPGLEYSKVSLRAQKGSAMGAARKCHFCVHRIEQGLLPACVLSCMGRATFFGDKNDPDSLISELIVKPNVMRLRPDMGTDPQVYYLI